jgi:hypothetical protein
MGMLGQHQPNMQIQDIIDVLIDNWIPPEWVDHGYPYRLAYLNQLITAWFQQDELSLIDNERVACLATFGVLTGILQWSG